MTTIQENSNLARANEQNLVISISSDTMGKGEEELGKILMKAFIHSLTELTNTPKILIFFNSGARLTSCESNTIDDLKTLEKKGTEVLTCGTCIDYYNLKEKLAVGIITNMYTIVEKMASADKIVNV